MKPDHMDSPRWSSCCLYRADNSGVFIHAFGCLALNLRLLGRQGDVSGVGNLLLNQQ